MQSKTYAVIKDEIVLNICISENASLLVLSYPDADDFIEVTEETGSAYINERYTGTKFLSPKPFDSWVLDEESVRWIAPIGYPVDGKSYYWTEEDQWVEIPAFDTIPE